MDTRKNCRLQTASLYFHSSSGDHRRPQPYSPFGTAGRNIARSDSYFNFDLGLHKQFKLPITDETRIDFRAEFFNLFNKTNFNAPNSDPSNANFGRISSIGSARQIQLALKLYF